MKGFRWAYTAVLASAAFVLVLGTLCADAQTASAPMPATAQATQAAKTMLPLDHLTQAKTVLDKLNPATAAESARPKIVEMKQKFAALDESYRKGGTQTVTQQPGATNSRVTIKKDPTWSPQVVAVDLIISQLLRPVPGGAGFESGIDQEIADTLTEFRKHLTAFAAAATGTVGAQKPS